MGQKYDPRQSMKWYNFLKWFLIFSLVWGLMSFVVNFNSGGYTFSDISNLLPEYTFFSTLQLVCNSVLAIALIIYLFEYSPRAPIVCLSLIVSTIIFSVLIYASAGEISNYILLTLVGNCLGVGVIQSINYFYLRKRLIKKYWPAVNTVAVEQEVAASQTRDQDCPPTESVPADMTPTATHINNIEALEAETVANPVVNTISDDDKPSHKNRPILGQWKGFVAGLLMSSLILIFAIPLYLTHQKQQEDQANNQIANKVAQLAFYKSVEEEADILIEEFISISQMDEHYVLYATVIPGSVNNLWGSSATYVSRGKDKVNSYYVEFVRNAPDKAEAVIKEYRRLCDIAYTHLNILSEKRNYVVAGAAIQNMQDAFKLQKDAQEAYDSTYKQLIRSLREK